MVNQLYLIVDKCNASSIGNFKYYNLMEIESANIISIFIFLIFGYSDKLAIFIWIY